MKNKELLEWRANAHNWVGHVVLANDIDLEAENYESTHGFNQRIVFVGIEQEKENEKPTGRAVAQAKIIKYSSIEDAEFIIEDKALAQLFKKNLKKLLMNNGKRMHHGRDTKRN